MVTRSLPSSLTLTFVYVGRPIEGDIAINNYKLPLAHFGHTNNTDNVDNDDDDDDEEDARMKSC